MAFAGRDTTMGHARQHSSLAPPRSLSRPSGGRILLRAMTFIWRPRLVSARTSSALGTRAVSVLAAFVPTDNIACRALVSLSLSPCRFSRCRAPTLTPPSLPSGPLALSLSGFHSLSLLLSSLALSRAHNETYIRVCVRAYACAHQLNACLALHRTMRMFTCALRRERRLLCQVRQRVLQVQ